MVLTEWSEGPSFLDQSVEKSQPEKEFLPLNWFLAAPEEGGVRDGMAHVGAQQVCSQAFGWLVGHFQTILQNTDWEMLGWVTG